MYISSIILFEIIFRFPATRKCCGGRVVAVSQECCGNATVGVPYDRDARKSCCGTSYVDSDTSLCCQNSIGQFQVILFYSCKVAFNESNVHVSLYKQLLH